MQRSSSSSNSSSVSSSHSLARRSSHHSSPNHSSDSQRTGRQSRSSDINENHNSADNPENSAVLVAHPAPSPSPSSPSPSSSSSSSSASSSSAQHVQSSSADSQTSLGTASGSQSTLTSLKSLTSTTTMTTTTIVTATYTTTTTASFPTDGTTRAVSSVTTSNNVTSGAGMHYASASAGASTPVSVVAGMIGAVVLIAIAVLVAYHRKLSRIPGQRSRQITPDFAKVWYDDSAKSDAESADGQHGSSSDTEADDGLARDSVVAFPFMETVVQQHTALQSRMALSSATLIDLYALRGASHTDSEYV
eukprot:m.17238 g.17238  ORF g.17238 m.17238 type:complete len:305 (-) comp8240_c0_seq3:323-1237(-)